MNSEIPLLPTELNHSPVSKWEGRVSNLLARSKDLLNLGPKLQELQDAAVGLKRDTKKLGQAAALAGGITLFTACSMFTPEVSAEAPTSTPTPTFFHNPDLVTNRNSQSAVTVKVTALESTDSAAQSQQPESSSTPVAISSQEKELEQKFVMSGHLEYSKDDPSWETLFFSFPKELEKVQVKDFSFALKSGTQITELALQPLGWLGEDSVNPPIKIKIASVTENIKLGDYIDANDNLYPDIFRNITAGYLNNNGVLTLIFHFPPGENEDIKKILENFQLGIKRRGDIPSGTLLGPIELKVEKPALCTLDKTFEGYGFDVDPYFKIPESSGQPSGFKVAPSEQNQRKSKWQKDWEPDVEVSAKEWFDDMVAKGFIVIDPLARQMASGEIDSINGYNLVPNPTKDYPQKGYSFYYNLEKYLNKIVIEGEGHVVVTSDAFENMPGGANCGVYYNTK